MTTKIDPNNATLNDVLKHLGYTVRKVAKKSSTTGFMNAITTPDGRDLGPMKAENAWWYLRQKHPELWGPKLPIENDERVFTRGDGTLVYVREDSDHDLREDGWTDCTQFFARNAHTGAAVEMDADERMELKRLFEGRV